VATFVAFTRWHNQYTIAHIRFQHTTYLSTSKGWKAELARLADLQWTVYPQQWSPISCRSSAGQGKFASKRPTFYHCAKRPTLYHVSAYWENFWLQTVFHELFDAINSKASSNPVWSLLCARIRRHTAKYHSICLLYECAHTHGQALNHWELYAATLAFKHK